jgi:hypothetical protein
MVDTEAATVIAAATMVARVEPTVEYGVAQFAVAQSVAAVVAPEADGK